MNKKYFTYCFLAFVFTLSALIRTSIVFATSSWTAELAIQTKQIKSVLVSPDGLQTAVIVREADLKAGTFSNKLFLVENATKKIVQLAKLISPPMHWSSNGESLWFLANGEKYQSIWKIDLANKKSKKILELENNILDFKISPNDKYIALTMSQKASSEEITAQKEKTDYVVSGKDVKSTQLYVVSLESSSSGKADNIKPLTPANYSVTSFNWNKDNQTIVFAHQPTELPDDLLKSRISLLDFKNQKISSLLAENFNLVALTPQFSPNGKWIAFKTLTPPTPISPLIQYALLGTYICIIAPTGKDLHYLPETPSERKDIIGWTKDSNNIILQGFYKTTLRLLKISIKNNSYLYLSPENIFINETATLNNNNSYLGFSLETPTIPAEAFISTVDNFSPKQITKLQKMPELPIKKIDIIHWKSIDNKQIEGILIYPKNYQEGVRAPLITALHGGPANSWKIEYLGKMVNDVPFSFAVLASKGYAIFAPNIRGSKGYGLEFAQGNYRDWGGKDFQDMMTGIDYLIKQGIVDPNKLGIWGWSYGGFMSAWAITQTNRFKAAVTGAGVVNLISMTGTSLSNEMVPRYFGSEFWKDKKIWLDRSSIMHVENVITPTLIQRGEADVVVPTTQSLEFYTALKRRNVPVISISYARQGHSFSEPKMLAVATKHMLDWFDKYLHSLSIVKT